MCERIKSIPLIKTKYTKLSGYAVSSTTNQKINVTGTLHFDDNKPTFSGNAILGAFTFDDKYDMVLSDNNSRTFKLHKCQLSNTQNFTSFVFIIIEAKIVYGQIQANDYCSFYSIIRTKKFSGKYFDILGRRDIIKLDHINSGMRLYYKPLSEIDDAKGYFYHSNRYSNLGSYIDKTIPTLSSLISFGMGDFAGIPYHLIWKNKKNYEIHLTGDKFTKEGSSIFYVESPPVLSDLLEYGWQGWQQHCPSINLSVLIDYYVLIANQKHIEPKMLLACVWMEAMKHQYAKNVQRYTMNRGGYFLKSGTTTKYSFKELVQEVYTHFHVGNGDLSFIPFRNEVVHQGQINLPFPHKLQQFDLLITSIEHILLDLLKYSGKIWSRKDNRYVMFPL